MAIPNLAAADREFFAALGDVVFANPFSPARAQLIVRLAPGAKPGDLTADREALARVVAPKLAPFLRDGAAGLQRLAAEDKRLLEPALLYVGYHRCVPELDALIDRQSDQHGEPLLVPFGEEVIGDLVRGGLSPEQAPRYFALYYQLRRAFFFIDRLLAGECESMRRLREALWNNLFTHDMRSFEAALWNHMEDFSTLLLGETGTGKGQAALVVGRSAFIPYQPEKRRFEANFTDTFIAINLSQFPENLIESELFGHRKGAFTGAIDHHQGVFERCDPRGALFLDEIGEVTIPVQIKLLQVLQDRTYTPVGGREPKRFGGRVIAATNRPLDELRRQGKFRDDFFYRLCSDVIELPTLQQRIAESPNELEQLVRLLVGRIAKSESPELVASVLEALEIGLPRDYPWPGNVRELEQAVRRILLTGRYSARVRDARDESERLVMQIHEGGVTAEQLLAGYCGLLYRQLGSYAAVAKQTGLDPRTARKYALAAKSG